jgi:hypothetical protein
VFRDVTAHAGVAGSGLWSTSAMWIDYDNDGYLDLFCGQYLHWTVATDIWCTLRGKMKKVCPPTSYSGEYCMLFHNEHDGTFADVSRRTGITNQKSRALGIAMIDYDDDGWTDVLLACDHSPNRLLHNEHGTFRDVGVASGIAYDETGATRAGMGIDWADVDRDGKPTVMIGNFIGEMDWVYKYAGNGAFVDRAPANGIGTQSLPYVTFGLLMFDYDYDAWPDMFCVNGHVFPGIEEIDSRTTYRQPSQLFRNLHNSTFEEVGLAYMHGAFARLISGRGACYGDIDNDGNIDLLVVNLNDFPLLLRCTRKNTNHYLRIKLRGTKSNRNGFGALIDARVGGLRMKEMMKSGSSYQGSNESVVTLGLGQAERVDRLVVRWNCGTVDTLNNVPADQVIVVTEGRGR